MSARTVSDRRWQLALTADEARLLHDALDVWTSLHADAPHEEISKIQIRIAVIIGAADGAAFHERTAGMEEL